MALTDTGDSMDSITLLLPYYSGDMFRDIFQAMYGFEILWTDNPVDTEQLIIKHEPDLAIEWQHGPDDFPIRDFLRKHGRRTPVFLSRNWGDPLALPDDPKDIDCAGYLSVPFTVEETAGQFYRILPDSKKSRLKKYCDSIRIEL